MEVIKLIKHCVFTTLAVVTALTAASCGEHLFDNEDDCDVTHRIKFCYDMNLKWADAFPSEVKSVNLYVFDDKGLFVKEYDAAGDMLAQPEWSLLLDLPAKRTYRFVAWCGLVNNGVAQESFTVPQPVAGVTTIDQLNATLNAVSREGVGLCSDSQLKFLYHGYLEATLEDNHDGREYIHTIYLTKDTNHIRIILQELSEDKDMNPKDYGFSIESANSRMEYDNAVVAKEVVTYLPWSRENDEVGVGKIDVTNGTVKYVKGVVADLSLARLMAAEKKDLMLTITNESSAEKEVIARVPLLQYALLSKKYYESAYGHPMDEQEFLDREDEYVVTFFLTSGKWMDAYVDIHQWRVVYHEYEVGS